MATKDQEAHKREDLEPLVDLELRLPPRVVCLEVLLRHQPLELPPRHPPPLVVLELLPRRQALELPPRHPHLAAPLPLRHLEHPPPLELPLPPLEQNPRVEVCLGLPPPRLPREDSLEPQRLRVVVCLEALPLRHHLEHPRLRLVGSLELPLRHLEVCLELLSLLRHLVPRLPRHLVSILCV